MKLTTVLGSVNNNPAYYKFIPKQIQFWRNFGIRFFCIFVGDSLPEELLSYKDSIYLWNQTPHLESVYVAQNIRLYYPALLSLPEDEMVMITDMDMLPVSETYYTSGLEQFSKDDFIYYRHIIDNKEFAMCYNAAHPSVWENIFNIHSLKDIERELLANNPKGFHGVPGSHGWSVDQEILYKKLINYKNLHILNRPLKRLHFSDFLYHIQRGDTQYIKNYDDAHFHRSYEKNLDFILLAEKELFG
jgi:hypothetical protein